MPVTSIYVILKELAFNTGAQSDPGIFNSIREYFKPHFINIVPVYFVSVAPVECYSQTQEQNSLLT